MLQPDTNDLALSHHYFDLHTLPKYFFFHRKAVLEIKLTTSTSTSTPPSDSPIASASTNSTFSTTTPDLNLNLNDTNPWQTYQVEWTIKVLRYRRMSSSANVMGVLKSVFFYEERIVPIFMSEKQKCTQKNLTPKRHARQLKKFCQKNPRMW